MTSGKCEEERLECEHAKQKGSFLARLGNRYRDKIVIKGLNE